MKINVILRQKLLENWFLSINSVLFLSGLEIIAVKNMVRMKYNSVTNKCCIFSIVVTIISIIVTVISIIQTAKKHKHQKSNRH